MMSNENKGILLGLLGVISFGLTLPATRYVIDYLDPIFIGLGRAVLAAMFAATILLARSQALPNKNQLKQLLVVAIGVVIGFPVLSAIAMRTVPASHGGVVLGILPLVTAVIGSAISTEKPSKGFWWTAVLGSVLVVVFSLSEGSVTLLLGDLLLIAAILFAATGYAVGGNLSKEMGGWQVICWALVISFPFIVIPAYIYAPQDIQSIPNSVLIGFLYLALVSQLLGFFFWYAGLAMGGVARVSQTQLLQPFVTLGASALLLGELVGLKILSFALVIVFIVAVSKRMPIKHQ